MADLTFGNTMDGPCIIMDKLSTILVEPGCTCIVSKQGNLRIEVGLQKVEKIGPELDTIQLSVFSHRFMSIAGNRILKNSSFEAKVGVLRASHKIFLSLTRKFE
jgi:5-oxoprolinase (ATP-hydrolysing)